MLSKKKLQVEKHNKMLFVNQEFKAYKIILYAVNWIHF